MSKNKVLLVEDSPSIQLIVNAAIGSLCDLTSVSTISDAEKELASHSFALLILDVGLPDGDGFTFCKNLKSQENLADLRVIFLTGQSEVDDRVQGFSLGADDYIVKPLEPKEFTARVVAKLNQISKAEVRTNFRKGIFHANLATQKMSAKKGESTEELNLTPIEFKLMVHFLQNEGKTFSRKELVHLVWGKLVHVSEHTVDTHISSLRKKIGESARYLRAVLKKGYCFSMTETPPEA